jgi:hypothetical protein
MSKDFRTDRHVEIQRHEANDHPGREFVHNLQDRIGETLCPVGFKHEASATVHIYIRESQGAFANYHNSAFICQIRGFEKIPEPQADAAFKTLMEELMRMYGRKVPEFRKT